ncbi:hypothetical protein [Corynebacterium sp.]|uniref:hypothetical protein n=1 Tax=Corynebacterium sp. TaxID=1720 RepID=UPI002901970E|nr:hypothetical protein [Corynebacterium sp.]MDU3111441.1 hypothetical protein [Corynebacterium sp.]
MTQKPTTTTTRAENSAGFPIPEGETMNLPATTGNQGAQMPAQTLMQKGVEKLRQHAELKQMAYDYAEFITKTGACPAIYKNKPMDAAAAIIRGTALGFDPDGALEAFFVIQGKTGMYARAMIAVAENVGCRVWEEEATDDSVTWCGIRPGDDKVERVTWTMELAERAGYTRNAKYKTNPREMLRAKCQAELARIVAPGALMGLVSEAEPDAHKPVRAEATRVDTQQGGALGALEAARQRVHARRQPEPEPEPAQDADVVTDDDPQLLAAVVDEYLSEIPKAQSQDEVTKIMNAAKEDGLPQEQFDTVRQAAKARWEELNNA